MCERETHTQKLKGGRGGGGVSQGQRDTHTQTERRRGVTRTESERDTHTQTGRQTNSLRGRGARGQRVKERASDTE